MDEQRIRQAIEVDVNCWSDDHLTRMMAAYQTANLETLVSRLTAFAIRVMDTDKRTDPEARYVVSVNITVIATHEDEASTMVERMLAGVAEHDIVDVFTESVDTRATLRELPDDYTGHCATVGCHNVARYVLDADDSYRCALHSTQSHNATL